MSTHRALSLPTAIFININVMLGIGVFINTVELAKVSGPLGAFMYILVGIMMLPLILSMAHMVRLHPEGGFYAYGKKEIGTFAGFLSAWGYFTGKLGSGAIVLHTAVVLIQNLIPSLQIIPTLLFDAGVIAIFVGLNTLNMQAGGKIQKTFIICKVIPILFAILVGIWLFQPDALTAATFDFGTIPTALPFVLFATVGFEVACSISNKIENPAKNAPRAILISYGIVIATVFLYQFIFYSALGNTLAQQTNYLQAFPALLNKLMPGNILLSAIIIKILHLGLAASALGGSYGTMFTNAWNLYTLGQHDHLFFKNIFTKLNKHAIPVACVAVEGIIYMSYLLITGGWQAPLQQLGALGCVLGYTFSVLALLIACKNKKYPNISIWIPALGFVNCLILIGACVRGMLMTSPAALCMLITLLVFGSVMYYVKKQESNNAPIIS